MDQREALTRHLTPHGVPLELGVRSTDIAEIMTGMDFAMLLGLLNPRHAAILLAQYCDDHVERMKCRAWWKMECIEHARHHGWQRSRPRMVEALAIYSLDEHLGVDTRCHVCLGTRAREIDRLKVTCPACEGLGFLPYGPGRWQLILGVDAKALERHWEPRIAWARGRLGRWSADAEYALRQRAG